MEHQALIHMEPLNIVYHLHWPWQHRARWNQAPSLHASAPVKSNKQLSLQVSHQATSNKQLNKWFHFINLMITTTMNVDN